MTGRRAVLTAQDNNQLAVHNSAFLSFVRTSAFYIFNLPSQHECSFLTRSLYNFSHIHSHESFDSSIHVEGGGARVFEPCASWQ